MNVMYVIKAWFLSITGRHKVWMTGTVVD